MKMKHPSHANGAGSTKVLCERYVVAASGPLIGLPFATQGPRMWSATWYCAGFGAQPVSPELTSQYFPLYLKGAGPSRRPLGMIRAHVFPSTAGRSMSV